MQTFGLTLQLKLTATIRSEFLAEARKEAQAPEATLFLRTMQERYPDDDDQFMLAVLKNALRTSLRLQTLNFMAVSSVGGRVSPVQIIEESIHAGAKTVEEFAVATDTPTGAVAVADSNAQQLRIGTDTPGALVNGLISERAE